MTVVEVSSTKKKEIVDLTDLCRKWLPNPKKADGVCHLFLLHTTAALTTADLDPGTDLDLLDAFDALVPKLSYRHPHDPTHTPDHVLSALLGASLSIPVKNGEPVLGEWQRIVLVELDGPRNREIAITFITEKSAAYP
jgi:secondary thiamine-phosphate synthase enzyme